jgi:hypothetical protein
MPNSGKQSACNPSHAVGRYTGGMFLPTTIKERRLTSGFGAEKIATTVPRARVLFSLITCIWVSAQVAHFGTVTFQAAYRKQGLSRCVPKVAVMYKCPESSDGPP